MQCAFFQDRSSVVVPPILFVCCSIFLVYYRTCALGKSLVVFSCPHCMKWYEGDKQALYCWQRLVRLPTTGSCTLALTATYSRTFEFCRCSVSKDHRGTCWWNMHCSAEQYSHAVCKFSELCSLSFVKLQWACALMLSIGQHSCNLLARIP